MKVKMLSFPSASAGFLNQLFLMKIMLHVTAQANVQQEDVAAKQASNCAL